MKVEPSNKDFPSFIIALGFPFPATYALTRERNPAPSDPGAETRTNHHLMLSQDSISKAMGPNACIFSHHMWMQEASSAQEFQMSMNDLKNKPSNSSSGTSKRCSTIHNSSEVCVLYKSFYRNSGVGPQASIYLTKVVVRFNHVIKHAPRARLTDSACLLASALDIWHWRNHTGYGRGGLMY